MNRTVLAWSLLGLAFVALAVVQQDRPWKRLQAEYRDLEIGRLRAELYEEQRRTAEPRERLRRELDDARRLFDAQGQEARRLRGDLAEERHAARWAAADLERLRARREALGDASTPGGELRQARRRFEDHQRAAADLEERLAGLRRKLDEAERRWRDEGERARSLEQRIAKLERGALWRRLPGLRGLDPTLTVVEATPPGVYRQTPAGRVDRVDRCMTCHLGAADREASAASLPRPFAGHPGDLVGEGTPHPPSLFGCTVCHGGDGRATDFSRAGHWPASAGAAAEWTEKWGFSRAALPREVILPPALVEAGCVHCHDDVLRPRARRAGEDRPSLDHGRRLVLRMGCSGCHDLDGAAHEEPAKRGPPLDNLAAKTTQEWTFHWIAAPRRFRPTTWMPGFFPDGAAGPREAAVIRAMVRYLWFYSQGAEESAVPAGDAEAGEALFASVGCAGCHLLDARATRDDAVFERLDGPNLARSGNKLRAAWLYEWLRDPRRHRPDTPMPNLRLSEKEAADLTAFLLSSRDAEWEQISVPSVDATVRDELVLEYLEEELTLAESQTRLEALNDREKDLYLGQRSLAAFGCHGCHDIPGLEDAPPVAESLAEIGSQARRFLADEPRAVLAHRRRPGLRSAPDFGLSRREAAAVLVNVLSWTSPAAEPWRRAEQGEAARALVTGRRLLTRYGCLGCHRLQASSRDPGGAVSESLADPALRPPDLITAGSRFQSPWLFAYLDDPGRYARRPWLTVRMPSFHLDPEEVNALVRFFAAHDDARLFEAPPPAPPARDVEVGRAMAAMLQCQRCHRDAPGARDLAPSELAPSYRGARERLRPDWVVEWILDPESRIPGTAMPAPFAKNEAGLPDASYLTATISAPMFSDQRNRLLPLFESEAELLAYLGDARRVAEALRAYLWSLDQ